MTRRHKFNARKVTIDGERFDSRVEAECWLRARDAVRLGHISLVDRNPEFLLLPSQALPTGKVEKPVRYRADLRLIANYGDHIVIEIKSDATAREPDYVLRRKMLFYFHGIAVTEIRSVAAFEKLLESLRHA